MDKNKKPKRYFNESKEDKNTTSIKLDKKLKFEGDVIKVEMKPKFIKNKLKFKKEKKPLDVDAKLLKKHSRGAKITSKGVKTNFFKEKIKRKEVALEYATEQAARTEVLRNETEG